MIKNDPFRHTTKMKTTLDNIDEITLRCDEKQVEMIIDQHTRKATRGPGKLQKNK